MGWVSVATEVSHGLISKHIFKVKLAGFANGSSMGEGNGTQLQYSCLENPMDGEAW